MAYIYEHIRTRGYEPLYLEEHYAYLEASAITHLHEPLKLSRKELLCAIEEALRSERFSPTVMNAVEVRYFNDGRLEVEPREILYNEFSLRALHPTAYICRASGDIILANTSAKEALIDFNRAATQNSERSVAIWVDDHDEVLAVDGAPVIAIFEDEVRFSRKGDGVEFDLAYNIASEMGLTVSKGAISIDDLNEAKELLFIGYEGLSAVGTYDANIYMDISAEMIASKIAEAEQI